MVTVIMTLFHNQLEIKYIFSIPAVYFHLLSLINPKSYVKLAIAVLAVLV